MSLRYIDSMGDHYTEAQAGLKWTTASFLTREAGLHGYGMRGVFRKGMLFPTNTIIMETYIKALGSSSGGPGQLFALYDDGFATVVGSPTEQIWCSLVAGGAIKVSRYGGNPALDAIAQTAPDLIHGDIWYHVGWKVFVHPTAGSVEVRLNGATVINVTGIRTINSVSPETPLNTYWSGQVGSFVLGDNGNAIVFDDLVVMDDVDDGISDVRLPGGGGFSKFIGPVEIKVKRPDGAGTLAEWTPTPAVPNYQNVDDIESDGDATYNAAASTAVNASDLFAMENLLAGEDVVAVQSLVLARKTEEGVAAIATLTRDTGVTTAGPTVYQPNSYAYMIRAEPTLPDGSLWDAASWNAIQYGYKRMV